MKLASYKSGVTERSPLIFFARWDRKETLKAWAISALCIVPLLAACPPHRSSPEKFVLKVTIDPAATEEIQTKIVPQKPFE
jgi:hypothetical protein